MNPYEELGVNTDADKETIKKAYRQKAKKLHPDAGGNAEAFSRVQQAYMVLSDPEQRQHYDETGKFKAEQLNDAAVNIIGVIFMSILDSDIPLHVNYVDMIKEMIRKKSNSLNDEIKKKIAQRVNLEKVRSKLKYKKKGIGIMQQMLDHKVNGIREEINDLQKKRDDLERAFTLANDYDFNPDKMPPINSINPTFFSFRNII